MVGDISKQQNLMNLKDFRAEGQLPLSKTQKLLEAGWGRMENTAEAKTNGPFSAHTSFRFFSASSRVPEASAPWLWDSEGDRVGKSDRPQGAPADRRNVPGSGLC